MSKLNNITGAIFDMDGTLVDSMGYWDSLVERYAASKGFECSEDILIYMNSITMAQGAQFLKDEYGVEGTIDEIMAEMNAGMVEPYEQHIVPKPGAIELLQDLKDAGIPICLATTTDRCLVDICLDRHDMRKYFDETFTCSEVGKSKQHPDIFNRCMEVIGGDIETTYVFEDALYSMKTAKSMGFQVVAVEDETARAEREEIKKTADIYVADPIELL